MSTIPLSELPSVIAYLDPGSGSILLQLILATLLGLGILVRSQWSKIKSLFIRKDVSGKDDQNDENE
jgi:hypothetical protein